MLALRNLARSAPRSVARLSTRTASPLPSIGRITSFQSAWKQSTPRLTSAFHMTAVARRSDSGVQEELVAKLQSEISVEEDDGEDADLSANIKEYIESSPYQIEDNPGQEEVVLTRTFGDEKIRIVFSTADLHNTAEDDFDPYNEDGESDEALDAQSGGVNSKGAVNQGRTPEDSAVDREELNDELDDEQDHVFPAKAHITIERPGKGALAIVAVCQDGDVIVEDFYHLPSAELAEPKNAEHEWKRQGVYAGPPFSNLDEDLQILFEKYLEERGINTRLALFIPDYIDQKERREYIQWLNKVKAFVE